MGCLTSFLPMSCTHESLPIAQAEGHVNWLGREWRSSEVGWTDMGGWVLGGQNKTGPMRLGAQSPKEVCLGWECCRWATLRAPGGGCRPC